MLLSKEVTRHKNNKENILTYVKNKGIIKINQYSANTGIPLCVIWYHVRENFNEYREEADKELKRICKFYRIKIDTDDKRTDQVVEKD
jgi:hypothetical protein